MLRPSPASPALTRASREGRMTLAAVTLGSGIAILDGTVVNVALPALGTDLAASIAQLQWVINGYMLALASLVLVGGSLGDRLGRRRIYLCGMGIFALASVLCALAPTPALLIAARILQGIGAGLLTPGALAIIQSSFVPGDRAAAIGTWAGLSGVASAIGPLVGGWLIDHGGWRWIFLMNVPLCAIVIALTLRYVPESLDDQARHRRFDAPGAALTILALGLLTYALIAVGSTPAPVVGVSLAAGVLALAGFVAYERRTRNALMPMGLFSSRIFSAANLMTFAVYGALGATTFFLVLQLQTSAGFTALGAGLALLPITIALMLLSSRAAALSARTGPRLPMTLGPLLCAAGVLLLLPVGAGSGYWTAVLPGLTVFALGLAALVSPLTASVLAAAPDRLAGVASGINNAVARVGSLLAVAALPGLVGLRGSDYARAAALTQAYQRAMVICAALLALGGVISWFGLRGTGPSADVSDGVSAAP